MRTGTTTKPAPASALFAAADYLETDQDVAFFLEAALEGGDSQDVLVALRTVADAVGGVGALAAKTGLNRESLYRTLSSRGNPRLDTLCAILAAFGLRLAVAPVAKKRSAKTSRAASPAMRRRA